MKLQPNIANAYEGFLRPSRYKVAYGGRGSGKSHFFAQAAVINAVSKHRFRMVCVREVQKSLKESAKRLIEDKIATLGVSHLFKVKRDEIETPGGGAILFQGMQDHTAESIKSLEGFNAAWVEEAHTLSARSLEMLRPTIREAGSELWFSFNPRNASDPVDRFFRGPSPPANAIIKHVNYDRNPWFPRELEEERQHDESHNRDRYGHIWLGDYEPTVVGSIWDRATIHACRVEEADRLERIVVAVDPAASSEPGSDEHGIVVCGLADHGTHRHGYVIDDYSLKGAPRQWADRAIAGYDRYGADCVVVERNMGGDMVKNTLRAVRPDLPIKEVVATRGKHVRAEPIAALYTLGRISHVGTYEKMEDQMCKMTAAGYEGEGSPDRLDAMVWGMTELFPQLKLEGSTRRKPTGPVVHLEGGWMA